MDIINQVIQIVKQVMEVNVDSINADSNFEDIGVDELSLMEVVVECESQFGIAIPDEAVITSVGELVQIIKDLK